MELSGKRVVVMGLGRFGGGVGAARHCAARGARVLVTDRLDAEALRASLDQLADLPIECRLGAHELGDFETADLVVVNPAVDPRSNRFLRAARDAGVTLTTEIELLLQQLPSRHRTIGVTGTAGKSTTTAMIGHVLRAQLGPDRVHVGGNLGGSLLADLERIRPDDWVVLELSSFMLELLEGFSPHIAVVTNLSENHLDRHGTLEAYASAKQRLLRHQQRGDWVVLGPGLADWALLTPATPVRIEEPAELELPVPGAHNRLNGALAAAACRCAGVEGPAVVEALGRFGGLPHRLELVAERGGVRFYNDSKSTTPAAAGLALESFAPRTVHIILGGFDKRSNLSHLAGRAAARAAAIYTIGQTGEAIAAAAERADPSRPLHRCGDLGAAVREAMRRAAPGQVVLLSPGCASWDQFDNYESRGERFRALVLQRHDRSA